MQFQQAARLESLLKHAQEQQVTLQYPLAVTLFDNSETAVQESTALKNSVLNQMIQHNLVAHPFYKFIQQNQFAPRVLSVKLMLIASVWINLITLFYKVNLR